jgi:uncharacterized protein (TIGR00369 family)
MPRLALVNKVDIDQRARVRTYGWTDPTQALTGTAAMSGLELVNVLLTAEISAPMNITLGIELVDVAEGHVVFEFQPQEWHYNVIGIVHGGMVCTITDTAMAMAVLSRLPAGFVPTTTDNQTRFYRAITEATGRVRCVGAVAHLARRTAAANAELRDSKGRLLAQASTTCLIIASPDSDADAKH